MQVLKVANPLYVLTQTSAVLLGYWGQSEQEAFHWLKQLLINAPIWAFLKCLFLEYVFSELA